MSDIARQLCDALPPKPLSVADVLAIKKKVYPDIDPMLGLQPAPRENVIVLHVSEAPKLSYLGVEDHGWTVLDSATVEESASLEAAVKGPLDTAMEWAETYYSSSTFAMLERRG